MPVTSFVEHTVYDLTPAPAPAKRVRAPAPARKKPAAPKGGLLTPQVVSVLSDRLDEAVEAGVIELVDDDGPFQGFAFTLAELAELLRILLREAYTAPTQRPLATRTAPGSDDRIAVYRARAGAGETLWCDHDATAHRAHDKGLRFKERLNGSGVKVLGWEEEEEE